MAAGFVRVRHMKTLYIARSHHVVFDTVSAVEAVYSEPWTSVCCKYLSKLSHVALFAIRITVGCFVAIGHVYQTTRHYETS